MLARSFMSAIDLGISEVERDALITVLGMLERGELAFEPRPSLRPGMDRNSFNMGGILSSSDSCGTVGCLCGWAFVVSGGQAFPFAMGSDVIEKADELPSGLKKLFRIGARGYLLFDIRPAQAAIALSNYLTTGQPSWAEAMASGHP